MSGPTQMLSVRLDGLTLRAVKERAEATGASASDVVRAALADYLAVKGEPGGWFAYPLSYTGYYQGNHVVCYGR